MFNSEAIIVKSKSNDFAKLIGCRVSDIIRRIYPIDRGILDSWRKFFKAKNVPFLVTRHKDENHRQFVWTLWKEVYDSTTTSFVLTEKGLAGIDSPKCQNE